MWQVIVKLNSHFFLVIFQVDCAIFGQLSQIVYIDLDFPYKDILDSECPNIKPYLERIKDTLWPDFDEIVNNEKFGK